MPAINGATGPDVYGRPPKPGKGDSDLAKQARRRPPSRKEKLARARAAGRRGEPAPDFIDDAELLGAYDEGASELGSGWAGDVDKPSSSASSSSPPVEEEPASKPAPLPEPGPLFGRRRTITSDQVRTSGPAGDVAGVFLGLIATAFAINVIKGTWTQWLRAKFLNQVGGSARPDPNAAPGQPLVVPPGTAATPAPPTIGNGQQNPQNLFGPGGVLQMQNGALTGVAAPGATLDPLTGSLASPLPYSTGQAAGQAAGSILQGMTGGG